MSFSYYQRIAAFLSQYSEEPVPPDPVWIREAISKMICEGGMSADEIRRDAMEYFDVIIGDRFFINENRN